MLTNKIKNLPKSILIFILTIAITSIIGIGSLFPNQNEYIYVTAQISPGLWWAMTQKPEIWYINNLSVGDKEKDFSGSILTELISFRHYPVVPSTNDLIFYDIFLDLKISVKRSSNGEYTYNRQKIAIGSPIEINFPKSQITATVINLSETPPNRNMIEKEIVITGSNAYIDQWEIESIPEKDIYNDGEQDVFVLKNKQIYNTPLVSNDLYGSLFPRTVSNRQNVFLTIDMLLEEKQNGQLYFGENQEITPGAPFTLITNKYSYTEFTVVSVE